MAFRSSVDSDEARFPRRTPDASRAKFFSSRCLCLFEAKFNDLSAVVIFAAWHQHGMHPIAVAELRVGALDQKRAHCGTVVEHDHADREQRLDSFATIMM